MSNHFSPAQLALLQAEPWELASPMPYSNDEASQQERREYILGTEPITDADIIVRQTELLDILADIADICMNHFNVDQAGVTELLRRAGRDSTARRQREVRL